MTSPLMVEIVERLIEAVTDSSQSVQYTGRAVALLAETVRQDIEARGALSAQARAPRKAHGRARLPSGRELTYEISSE